MKKLNILTIYNRVKKFYPFYFNENNGIYFLTDEALRLYKVVKNKYKTRVYNENISNLLAAFRERFPESDLFEIKNNRPSVTFRLDYYFEIFPFSDIRIYISFCLILKSYVLIIECTSKYIGKVCFGVPTNELKSLYNEINTMIQNKMSDYTFFTPTYFYAKFFNLVVPGYTKSNKFDGSLLIKSDLLNALFFEYETTEIMMLGSRDEKHKMEPLTEERYHSMMQVLFNNEQVIVQK